MSEGINEAIMRATALVLALIATPALADVAGTASVIDGDTIEVHGQRIRLHGIDAPESRQLCRLNGRRCGVGDGEFVKPWEWWRAKR